MLLGIPIFELLTNPIIMVLILVSIVSFGAILDRLFILRGLRFDYAGFLGKIRAFLTLGDKEGALKYVDTIDHPFARVCKAGLGNCALRRDALYNTLDNSIEDENKKLENHVGMLSTIAYISPLLGLLGTVIGIIRAFSAMALAGGGTPTVMMLGIAVALLTTAIGIIIAVPAAIMYGFLSGYVDANKDNLVIGSRDLVLILSEENIMDRTPVRVRRTKRGTNWEEGTSSAMDAMMPGINVAMLLILFFMMFAPLMYQSNISVSTPALASAQIPQERQKRTEVKLNVYIAKDGTVFINEEPFGKTDNPEDRKRQNDIMHQLLLRSTMRMVLLSAHSTVYHKDVVNMIDRAKQAGAVKIALLKRKEKRG
ncbi:hypothetical protein CH333_06385 [candidate division WOR-3 bacterium JGI_Cruoil_03_44_89]|uniref:MotA/TolQ/ExbB proton channel domain-containing protein n=1 Tax=candidate division WOR-3 bacterium JGI_Cruoil_03_44_89 TaxID=1973748 RepID=A0A235BUB9_UNCW3|nr:MAG: hypothetical protein CH333_06385 [candidate division WOR-3 bacterium JGI_Cruoil_03_44_89]